MDATTSIQSAHTAQPFITLIIGTAIVIAGSAVMSLGFVIDSVLRGIRKRCDADLRSANCADGDNVAMDA